MDIHSLVDFLDDAGELGRPDIDIPWPEYDPEEYDAYLLDWDALFAPDERVDNSLAPVAGELVEDILWAAAGGAPSEDEAAEMASRRPEVCAWYQPIHWYGMNWGIFILDDCVARIAVDIAHFLEDLQGMNPHVLASQLLRAAFTTLFLHEAFHHKTESLAIRLHVVERTARYRNYTRLVYIPDQRSPDGSLEEALANADSHRRLNETTFTRRLSKPVRDATRNYLAWRFPMDPPGYREASKYLSNRNYERGLAKFKSQVQESKSKPFRHHRDWEFAPGIQQSFFSIRSDIWALTKRGGAPTLPTFPLYRPASTKDVEAALHRVFGYARKKGGKGSHIKLTAPNRPTLILPGNRKDLSPVVLKSVAKALGFDDTGSLLVDLGL